MSRFIDLMADVVFTDGDITARTEAMVRNEFSAEAETILNRKVTGAGLGIYALTADDQAALGRFAAVTQAAALAGEAARVDMTKLRQAMAYETATQRLAQPAYDGPLATVDEEGVEHPHPDAVRDDDERAAAQSVIDAASPETLDLVAAREAYRNPVAEVTDAPTE